MLDSLWGVSFGATGTSLQSPDSHRTRLLASASSSSPSSGIVRSALKKFVAQFFAPGSQEVQAQPNSLHNHYEIQPEPSDTPECLLKAEQERTRQLRQELLTVRSALKQMDDLQAELAVERETGKQLVKFLEEAEQEAWKVPILEQLLRQQGDFENKAGNCVADEQPIVQRPTPRAY
jgi:hypothetical protein